MVSLIDRILMVTSILPVIGMDAAAALLAEISEGGVDLVDAYVILEPTPTEPTREDVIKDALALIDDIERGEQN